MSLGCVHLSSARRLADEEQNQDARRSTLAVSADNQHVNWFFDEHHGSNTSR